MKLTASPPRRGSSASRPQIILPLKPRQRRSADPLREVSESALQRPQKPWCWGRVSGDLRRTVPLLLSVVEDGAPFQGTQPSAGAARFGVGALHPSLPMEDLSTLLD